MPSKQQTGEVTLDPSLDPDLSEVTRPSDLGFAPKPREIEVDLIDEPPPELGSDGMVEIRMAETIEEFTYGNPHMIYKLEQGKRYRVPAYIASYLHGLGKLYQRS